MRIPVFRSLAAALALTLAAAAPWAAEDTADDDRKGARRTDDDPEEMVCRRIKVTGSHMRQRVCHKQREWDQMREASQDHMQNRRPSYEPGQNQ